MIVAIYLNPFGLSNENRAHSEDQTHWFING